MKIDNSIKNITPKENSYTGSNSCQFNHLEVKIGIEMEELEQAKQLWLDISHTQSILKQTKQQLDDRMALIYDGYDSYAKHLIVRDINLDQVVAYTRIIDSKTAYNIGGYFCEALFNLDHFRIHMRGALELSRLVIAPQFSQADILAALWSGIIQYAKEQHANMVFGTLPLSLGDNHCLASKEIKRLKAKYLSSNKYRVIPFQILPPAPSIFASHFADNQCNPSVELEYFFEQGAKLCGEAAWNKSMNLAELFFYLKPEMAQKLPHCIQQSEVNIAGLVA